MKRLVYAPSVNVWVKTDTGVIDLSPYVTGFNINRKTNAVSTAEVTFRNPKVDTGDGKERYLFTQHKTKMSDGHDSYRPMIHPMDPIIITLTRLKGNPVQVFTGYCDETPYVQLFPGVSKLSASCTLKRLLYTYWDPGLPFVSEFMIKNGWLLKGGQTLNAAAETSSESELNDSSIGYLLYKVLQDIGGWKHDDIYIQSLPSKAIGNIVTGIYQDLTGDAKASFQIFSDFLKEVVGTGDLGGAGTNPASGGDGQGDPNAKAAAVGYPLGKLGSFGGGPGQGTHQWGGTFNNWQSCNAVDIMIPDGTPVFAVDDGTITRLGGSYSGGASRTDGYTFHLITKDNDWFYQHNSVRNVTDGQKVKKGQKLGLSGSGNGVPHLHIACKNGNPVKLIGNIPGAQS